jgi:glycosyltransferase involved in cell wall biosynthesis
MDNLRTEVEIIKDWIGSLDKPLVTVLCTSYNHEKYIEQTIEGFLTQETNFPFEVIIHDDASTDNSQKIIKEYEEKYPKIIKGVYQIKNRFSQGLKNGPILYPMAKGEYVALCDGDDYWTDSKKLQIQIDEMKKYPEVELSFHPARQLVDEKLGKEIAHHSDDKKIFTISEVIRGDGGFCPTISLMIKQNVLINLPEFYYTKAPVGDLYLQIFASLKGGALYIPNNMAVYRVNSIGSWSSQINNYNKMNKLTNKSIEAMDAMNDFLENRYSNDISYLKSKTYYKLAVFCICNDLFKEFEEIIIKAYNMKPCFNRVKVLFYFRKIKFILNIFKSLKKC